MITQEQIDRINVLARKSKTPEGLTPEEKEEQQRLRKEYIDAFKANLRSQLENIEFVDKVEESEGRNKEDYVIELEEEMH